MLKKLTGYGFWIGIVVACMPLLMYLFGSGRQWQLHHSWESAQASSDSAQTDSDPAPPAPDNDDGLVRLRIPRLHLNSMVVGDVTESALATGPGHFPSTALPGQIGNCAIAAHRNMWGCWFANLDQLEPGDKVVLETMKRHYVYKVTGSETVSPTDTALLKAHGHKKELTLVTCTLPPTERIVVHGILDHTSNG